MRSSGVVSIVMPLYNAEAFVAQAIESVLAQTFTEWELWVVDDASQDASCDRIHPYLSDNRIRFLRRDENSGSPAVPRNLGIAEANGRYLAFLDADDLWEPDKLERQLILAENTGAGLIYSGCYVLNEAGGKTGQRIPPVHTTYNELLRLNVITCSSSLYDTRIAGKRYFPCVGHEDYALWLSLLRDGVKAAGLADPLVSYRRVSGSASSNKLRTLRYFYNIYRKHEQQSVAKALLSTLNYIYNAWRVHY